MKIKSGKRMGRFTIKVYLSATFKNRDRLRPIRDRFWAIGYNVISTWLDETYHPENMTACEWQKKLANKDRAEVLSADLFILDAEGISVGKSVEFGLALGQFHSKIIWVVGIPNHIFHQLADRVFLDWDECFNYIKDNFPTYDLQDASPGDKK